jgi:hypothetical protein
MEIEQSVVFKNNCMQFLKNGLTLFSYAQCQLKGGNLPKVEI